MDTTQSVVGNEMRQHPVTDAVAPASQSFANNSADNSVDQMVSNAEFLRALFPKLDQGEYIWTAAFATNPQEAGDPEWKGSRTYVDNLRDTPYGNSYFSVAALKPVKRSYKRRRENFSYMPVVVLDDSKGCDLAPSWRLETSQDNYQTGFLLDKPITDVEVASRLTTALAEQGCVMKLDKNGNNAVRYMRLPVGRNTKHQPPFQCKLASWSPNHKVSLADLCQALEIDHNKVVNGEPKKSAPPKKSSQPTVRTIIDLGSAIDHLDADGYSDWIKIGLALSSLKGSDLEDSALELFHKVSEKSDKYDAAECDAKWSKDLNADSLTYKSIFHWAKERGWVNPQTEDQPTVIEIEPWTGKPVDVYSEQPCPNFPLDVLPQELINYAQGYSDSSGFDVGAFAFTTLFGTMGLIDKRARIKASDTWFQPPTIWAAVADSSGGGKSMVISTGAKLLNSINKKIVTDSMRESDSFNKAKAALNNKALQGELQKPDWHQIVVEDTTTEALADVLKTNPRGVTLIADEMTGFIGNLDAYSSGGGDRDRGIYLSAYDGGSKTINRKGAGYTYVPNFAVSILTGVQPAKLADLYKKSAAGGADGLYQRFLTYNMQPAKSMNINSKLGTFTESNAHALAEHIERWTREGVFLSDTPSLSSEAAKVVEDYCNSISGVAKRTVNERFREHLFKYKGFLLRIALGLHVIHAAGRGKMFGGVVEVESINRAKSLLACLYHHSDSIYNLLDVDNGTTAKTRLVAEFILVKKIDKFSFGDVSRQIESFRNWVPLAREAVFDRLIEFDWIRDVTPMLSGKRGRPTMGKFIVNPMVHSEFSDTSKRLAIGRAERFDLLQKTIQAKKGVLS
jgi:hypothetical protein